MEHWSDNIEESHYSEASPGSDLYLEGLNEVQREAVLHDQGPLLILAGAGSGKTRVITHRIAFLIRERRVAPWNIAAVTFTNKAPAEMRERLEGLIGLTARDVRVRTFHSLGLLMLRRYADRVGLPSNFSVYDTAAQKSLIKEILKSERVPDDFLRPDQVLSRIHGLRDQLKGPDDYYPGNDPHDQQIASIYRIYLRRLRENAAVDYGDLLFEPVRLLREDGEVLAFYQSLWQYFLIDEYQDTNHAQYMLGYLVARKHHNITVVGDDDQSIYSWRGADISNILSFEKDYPECRILRLEENYRSTTPILLAASSLISKNSSRREKTLFTRSEGGEKIGTIIAAQDSDEVLSISEKIYRLQREGYSLSQIAIFYRTNAQSRLFEQIFREKGIAFRLVGGFRFFDRHEIKDAIAYFAVVVNPRDTISLLRIVNTPARGVGAVGIEKLQKLAEANGCTLLDALALAMTIKGLRGAKKAVELERLFRVWQSRAARKESPSLLARDILEQSGYLDSLRNTTSPEEKSRLENIEEFLSAVSEYEERALAANEEPDLADFLQTVALQTSEEEPGSEPGDAVVLMTLHNAKGLEFPCVFITGVEEGLIPHSLALEEGGVEEERRLLYVGITRARQRLFLSRCERRRVFQEYQYRLASRFFEEIDPSVFAAASAMPQVARSAPTHFGSQSSRHSPSRDQRPQQKVSFSTRDRLFHRKFGEGVVERVETTVGGDKLTVRFLRDGSVRQLLAALAPVEKI